MKVVEKAILSTDLALYFRKKTVFQEVANTGEIDWQGEEKKDRKTIYIKTLIFSMISKRSTLTLLIIYHL